MMTTTNCAPRFLSGRTLITPRAMAAIVNAGDNPSAFLDRHFAGDWGDLNKADKWANEIALRDGERIQSAYVMRNGLKVWIITEADRSATTMLLPSEY